MWKSVLGQGARGWKEKRAGTHAAPATRLDCQAEPRLDGDEGNLQGREINWKLWSTERTRVKFESQSRENLKLFEG